MTITRWYDSVMAMVRWYDNDEAMLYRAIVIASWRCRYSVIALSIFFAYALLPRKLFKHPGLGLGRWSNGAMTMARWCEDEPPTYILSNVKRKCIVLGRGYDIRRLMKMRTIQFLGTYSTKWLKIFSG